MAQTINQVDVMNILHNQMGHRVSPGGTDDDLKRYVQQAFNYCWRYYKWSFSLTTGTVDPLDGLLPEDFDLDGWYRFSGVTIVPIEDTIATGNTSSGITWDDAEGRYKLDPLAGGTLVYQKTPPTLGTDADGSAPFPSAIAVAEGAVIFAKLGENPTRADISQEWDLFHSLLDRLVGRADANRTYKRPVNRHDAVGTYPGDVGG